MTALADLLSGAPRETQRASPHAADAELARRCLQGDADAQRRFVERYTPMIYSVCRRSGLPAAEAEDVCQDVFCLAFPALARYRGESRLSSWLFVLARRRVADHFRSPARRDVPAGHPGDAGLPLPASGESPEAAALAADRAAQVRRALESLREPARGILMAYYLAEMPVKEIARAFGMNEANVKTALHRGRHSLRRALEEP